MISTPIALVAVIFYSITLALSQELTWYILLPILILLILKASLKSVLKKLLFLNIFILLICASALLYKEYDLALLIFFRANAILLFTLLLFNNKDIFSIASSLQVLRFPEQIASLVFFVGKFIFLMKEEIRISKKVMKSRSFKEQSNVFTYNIYANFLGILLIKCFEKAQSLKYAMILRNYNGKIYQSKYESFTYSDAILLTSLFLFFILHVGAFYI